MTNPNGGDKPFLSPRDPISDRSVGILNIRVEAVAGKEPSLVEEVEFRIFVALCGTPHVSLMYEMSGVVGQRYVERRDRGTGGVVFVYFVVLDMLLPS